MLRFFGVRLFLKLWRSALSRPSLSCWLVVVVRSCGLVSFRWNFAFCSSSLLKCTKTTQVVLPWQSICIYVGAASMLPFMCTLFNNSSMTESSMLNNALLQRRLPPLGPKLCLEYRSNPLQINFLATSTLTAKDFHLAFPVPVCLLKHSSCFSWSRWSLFFVPWCYVASVALLLMCLSQAFKQGGVHAMFWHFNFFFLMNVFFTYVFCSNLSYVVYHWLFEWGGVSESSCDSGMCRRWLGSVTVGVHFLVSWEILKVPLFRIPPLLCWKTDVQESGVEPWDVRPCAEGPARSVA